MDQQNVKTWYNNRKTKERKKGKQTNNGGNRTRKPGNNNRNNQMQFQGFYKENKYFPFPNPFFGHQEYHQQFPQHPHVYNYNAPHPQQVYPQQHPHPQPHLLQHLHQHPHHHQQPQPHQRPPLLMTPPQYQIYGHNQVPMPQQNMQSLIPYPPPAISPVPYSASGYPMGSQVIFPGNQYAMMPGIIPPSMHIGAQSPYELPQPFPVPQVPAEQIDSPMHWVSKGTTYYHVPLQPEVQGGCQTANASAFVDNQQQQHQQPKDNNAITILENKKVKIESPTEGADSGLEDLSPVI